jgi:hypothetical protein
LTITQGWGVRTKPKVGRNATGSNFDFLTGAKLYPLATDLKSEGSATRPKLGGLNSGAVRGKVKSGTRLITPSAAHAVIIHKQVR